MAWNIRRIYGELKDTEYAILQKNTGAGYEICSGVFLECVCILKISYLILGCSSTFEQSWKMMKEILEKIALSIVNDAKNEFYKMFVTLKEEIESGWI